MTNSIIQHSFQDTPVFFQSDAFLNATGIAKKFNKRPADYLKSDSTISYLESITRILVIPQNQLVKVKKGSSANGGGTWLHPKLAIDFARWLNPDFAVWCDMQIEKILHPVRNALVVLPKLTPRQQRHIQGVVKKLVNTQVGSTYSVVWGSIKKEFDVGTYKDIPEAKYQDLCGFLKCEPLEGELLPNKDNLPATPEGKDYEAAKLLITRLRGLAGFAMPSSMLNEMNDDIDKLEYCLASAWTEIDEALFMMSHATTFLKR